MAQRGKKQAQRERSKRREQPARSRHYFRLYEAEYATMRCFCSPRPAIVNRMTSPARR